MSRYIPGTETEKKAMLADIGLESLEQLFSDIPESVRLKRDLQIPEALPEMEMVKHMQGLAQRNRNLDEYTCFLGAGSYDHFIPSVVGHIISRQEFYTAYTPYQPEISQGTLQAIFEYQSMICELTGMDVANASMYDGATALAEAANVACKTTRRKEVVVARSVNPEYRKVLRTYARFNGYGVREAACENGLVSPARLEEAITPDTAAVIIQTPNFFGAIESLSDASQVAAQRGALLIAGVDPVSLGVLKSPGELGADIVVGEGQVLGNPPGFGGPYLGFFAAREKLLRQMPGRIVGQTTDRAGQRGFVLTMQTREQHIRREKATSNICSNQALNALAATVYLTVMGKQGLREVANLCLQKAHYAQAKLLETTLFTAPFSAPFFKEFVVKSKKPVAELNRKLLQAGIIGGYQLERDYPELEGYWLVAVTEKRTREEIDELVRKAGEL